MNPSTATGSPLHAFVLLTRGAPGVDYPARILESGVPSVRYHPLGGHDAFLVVRPGSSLSDAALAAEAELQDVLGSSGWVLLCTSCEEPLTLAQVGYACRRHGCVGLTGEDAPPLPHQRAKRPSRHRSRSAHKRDALGASWVKFVEDTSVAPLPTLVRSPDGTISLSSGAPVSGPLGALDAVREELTAMLEESLIETIDPQEEDVL